jgi:serine/threonine-protein kinase
MIADRGSVKVLDFGVAKLTQSAGDGSAITRLGELVGTPEYMAPEQAGGGEVDHRADLYALGVMLYELLAGRPPFSGADHVAIVAKHFVEPPPPLPDSIPEATRSLVMALLEKEPAARLQTAAEVALRIERARAEIPAVSEAKISEPTASTSAPAPPSRRRALWLGAAALVAAIAIAAGVARGVGSRTSLAAASADMTASVSAASSTTSRAEPAAAAALPAKSAETVTSAAAAESEEPRATPAAETNTVQARRSAPARPVPTVTSTALPKGKRIIIRRRVIRRTTITTR